MFAVLVATSCTPFADYCAEQTECQGGNDKDEEACVAQQEHAEERASIWDCSDAFDDLNACNESQSSCEDVGGAMTFHATTPCATENQAYADCLVAAGAIDAPEASP